MEGAGWCLTSNIFGGGGGVGRRLGGRCGAVGGEAAFVLDAAEAASLDDVGRMMTGWNLGGRRMRNGNGY